MAETGKDPMRPSAERLRAALRCGASSRRTGQPCQGPAMPNGRCRMHGGASTGPQTAVGLDRIRAVRTRHGFYGVEGVKLRTIVRLLKGETKRLVETT